MQCRCNIATQMQPRNNLTLLPTGLSFPGCHGGGQNLPPQLKSHLGVLDSNSFIHALKAISNQPKSKKKFKKFSKTAEKSHFKKKFLKFSSLSGHHENVRYAAKIQYFELQFFANILIFIVLIDSTKKTQGYRGSCGVTFENLEFFRFLRGPNGRLPKKISLKTV